MQYEWDAAKNRANLAKHGIDFADAVAVFEDDLALTRPDAAAGRHLVVVFTERGTRIRIISARVATKAERKYYEG